MNVTYTIDKQKCTPNRTVTQIHPLIYAIYNGDKSEPLVQAFLEESSSCYHLMDIWVKPELRGNGLATTILMHIACCLNKPVKVTFDSTNTIMECVMNKIGQIS